jgi:DNA replication and repair protein RecF
LTALLRFDRIAVHGVRNLKAAEYEFSRSVNVLVGGNGQGKTSILEALCIAATGRSFRTEQLREVLQNGQDSLVVAAHLDEDGLRRHQRLILDGHQRQGFIDGKRTTKLAQYAMCSPIVVFHPSDLELVTGSATTRRNLLARMALYSDATTQDTRLAYARALRHRQLLLEQSPSSKALLAFESLVAEHGYELAHINARAATHLCKSLADVFLELSASDLSLDLHFDATEVPDVETYRRQLHELRSADRQRGRATFGPHRDDLQLLLAGLSARRHASQGQQRLLALALKLAELRCIQEIRQVHPVLLLDDVVSELDRNRTVNVFEWIKTTNSQIFITAPREDVLRASDFPDRDQRIFFVEQGEMRGQKLHAEVTGP